MAQLSLRQLWAGHLAAVPEEDFPLKCKYCSKGLRGCALQQHEKWCPKKPVAAGLAPGPAPGGIVVPGKRARGPADTGREAKAKRGEGGWRGSNALPSSSNDDDEVEAEAEGLQLHLSRNNPTGYKCVYKVPSGYPGAGRFRAWRMVHGRQAWLGYFDTAVEAAAYAERMRLHPGPQVSAAAAGPATGHAPEPEAATVGPTPAPGPELSAVAAGPAPGYAPGPEAATVGPTPPAPAAGVPGHRLLRLDSLEMNRQRMRAPKKKLDKRKDNKGAAVRKRKSSEDKLAQVEKLEGHIGMGLSMRTAAEKIGISSSQATTWLKLKKDGKLQKASRAWEMEAMASCDCDAYVAPAAENEANVRAAMQSAVSLPPFALPMLHAVRQASQAMLRNLPLPPSLGGDHEVLRHVCDVDKQGELVWCLPARSDVRTFAGAKHVLEQKGFGAVQQLVLLGFVHILYHVDSTCFALAMMLCHPALCPCPPEALLERATAWADALEGVWAIIEEFFKNKRVVRGLLVEKPTLRGVNALLPDRNPSNWNRSSKTDWRMLVADLRCGCWLQACVSLAEAFQGPTMSYESCLRALRVAEVTCAGVRTKLSYYNGKPTSYISIHFLRCYSVATDVRCADDADTWKSLCHMGGGVERYRYSYEQARIALDGVTASLAPPARYHLDDLACLMCLAQHFSTSVRLELHRGA